MSAPLDEIRGALEAHAQFDDTAALARLGSVKARIRVVRRRRRAALAGAAAAVVAVAGGVATLLPDRHEIAPASRTFGTLTAPATMTSGGATYRFERLVTGDREVRWSDDRSGPSLVAWAGSTDAPVAVTRTDDERSYTSADDFGDFLTLEGKDEQTVQVVAPRGRVALAIYALAQPPAGARADIDGTPVVFRYDLPGYREIGAAWGEPGQTDLRLVFPYPRRELDMTHFCSAPRGYEVHVDLTGPMSWGACDDTPSVYGPGERVGFTEGLERAGGMPVRPGEILTAHVWLTRKGSDEPVRGPVDGVRLGVAAYEREPAVARIGTWPLTGLREEAGHVWRFQRVLASSGPSADPTITLPAADRPRLVVLTAGPDSGVVTLVVDGVESTSYENETGGGTFLATEGPLDAGPHTVHVRAKHPVAVEMALYEQAD